VREDAQHLEAALAETLLAGREITTVALSRWDELVFAIRLESHEGQAAWRAGRSVLEQTGRWPIVVNSYPDGRAPTNR
jgi:urease accessory protein UreF